MRYQPHIRCNIAYTPWPIPSTTSVDLSNITSFVRPVIPLSANTDTAISFSLRIVGQPFLAVGWLDYIVITHMCPNLLNTSSHENPNGRFGGNGSNRNFILRLTAVCSTFELHSQILIGIAFNVYHLSMWTSCHHIHFDVLFFIE